ncbi:MAG: hypothetical protein IPP17_09065 [Bacteroidetes bacterium]|nr:hypothetical protein [Bacteroidota bacterium]
MRNLANIGFEAHSLEEFQALAEMVYRKGKAFRAGRNQYYCFQDPSGGELWVQIDSDEQIAGMNCHFHSSNAIEVELLHAQGYEERPLDGTFEARALHADAGTPASAPHPIFAFDLPDAHLVPHVLLPAKASVQLVGFARDVHVYENVEDYRKAHPGKPLEGLRPIEQDRAHTERISSLMRLDGIVVHAAHKRNHHTQQEFYWLEIKTVFGNIDVVVANRSLPFVPQQGQVFDGEVRLTGRVQIKDAHAQKPGLIERMFWR